MIRDEARQELLTRLNASGTHAARNKLGQFATPPQLASEIVRHAVSMLTRTDRRQIRFLEPGFGTGPFYSSLLSSEKHVSAACGFEIDPHYGEPVRQHWSGTLLQLTIGDFTKAEPPKSDFDKFNLVVCNPPYVRHHHLTPARKRDLQSTVVYRTGFEMNGLSGLYAYFMVLSKAWMTEGGVGAWLIPSEFMDVNYGRKVKQFLLEKVTLDEIHRCDPDEVQFDDALVSSAIVFFRNSRPPKNHEVRFSYGGSLIAPRLSDMIETERLRDTAKWTGLPRNVSRRPGPCKTETLASLFKIKRGLATGCNSFFVLTAEAVEQNEIPKEFLIPILPSPRDLEVNDVTADKCGFPKIKHRLFLLSCHASEDEIRAKYPSLWRYLEKGMKEGVHQRYLCRHRAPWYSQELRPPAPLLCTYMGRPTKRSDVPFRFIRNHSKATAANVYLMLYPKPALTSIFNKNPRVLNDVWKAFCSITAEVLTEEGRVYGGGLHKLEPKELANVSADVILKVLPRNARRETQQHLFS